MISRPVGGQRWSAVVAGRAAFALLLVLSGLVVTAAPAAAEVQLSVEVGIDGRFATGLPMPVRVRVVADRLISGHLAISSFADGEVHQTIEVELAAGSTKEFVAIVPTAIGNNSQIEVQLLDGDTVIAQERGSAQFAPGDELVGLLPELDRATDAPTSASLAIGTDTARITAVPESLLRAGAAALAPYDQILGLPSDLTALGEDGRAALLQWVADGGTLLIDADDSAEPTALGDELWPQRDGPVRLGVGTIQLTGGVAVAGGSWSAMLWPTPARAPFDGNVVWQFDEGFFDPSQSLSEDAGFRLPDVGTLLVLLGVYIVIVGPVTYRILRRRGRHTLTWIAVPAASVLFSAIFFVQGRDLRSGASNAHITVYEQTDQGTTALTATMLSSRNGATATLEAPAGWHPWPWLDSWLGGFDQFGRNGPITAPMAIHPAGTTAKVELGPGAFQVIEARGAVDVALLDVQASSASTGAVEIEITNTSPVTLREVVAVTGRQTLDVDDLAPGATRTITIEGATDRIAADRRDGGLFGDTLEGVFDGDVMRGDVMFDDFGQPVLPDSTRDGPVAPGVWSKYTSEKGSNLFAPGRVIVAAWSDELPAPVLRDGKPITAGRSLIVRTAEVDAASAMVSDASTSLEVVRGGDDPFGMMGPPAPDAEDPADEEDLDELSRDEAFVRLLLPRQVDGSAVERDGLVLDLPSDLRMAHLWLDGEWTELFVGLGERRRLLLPADAAVGGSLWLRIGSSWVVDQQRDDPKAERTVVVYHVDSEDDAEVEVTTIEDLAALARRFAEIRTEAAATGGTATTTTNRVPPGLNPGVEPGATVTTVVAP